MHTITDVIGHPLTRFTDEVGSGCAVQISRRGDTHQPVILLVVEEDPEGAAVDAPAIVLTQAMARDLLPLLASFAFRGTY